MTARYFEIFVDEVDWYFPDVLVDHAVEIEVEGVVAGPEKVTEDVVVLVKILDPFILSAPGDAGHVYREVDSVRQGEEQVTRGDQN